MGKSDRPGFFTRLKKVTKTKMNDIADSMEDGKEHKILAIEIEDMEDAYKKMENAYAEASAVVSQLKAERAQHQAKADRYVSQAELAVEAGDDDLAAEALDRASDEEALVEDLDQRIEMNAEMVAEYKANMLNTKKNIKKSKESLSKLSAQNEMLNAQNKMETLLDSSSFSDNSDRVSKWEDKINKKSAAQKAKAQLRHEANGGDFDDKFKALERSATTSKNSDRLAQMKAKREATTGGVDISKQ